MDGRPIVDFDAVALFEAMDRQRHERGLSWRQVADEVWEQSAVLNRRRGDHPISPATITNMAKRGDTSCQHALFFLRWLGRTPESFLPGMPADVPSVAFPDPGPDRRLRWDLAATHAALNSRRQERQLTWPQVARRLRCTPSQLTGIRTARFGISMRVAMRITQWLEVPAADFVHPAAW